MMHMSSVGSGQARQAGTPRRSEMSAAAQTVQRYNASSTTWPYRGPRMKNEGVLGSKYTYKNVPGIHSGYGLRSLALASSTVGAFGLCLLLAFAFLVAAAAAAFGIGFTHGGLEAGVVLLIERDGEEEGGGR